MNLQIKSKAQATQTVWKEISPIIRLTPRIQDDITVVVPDEVVAPREREVGEDSLNEKLSVDYLH